MLVKFRAILRKKGKNILKLSYLICSDELEVHREEDVFNAVIKWAECKADTW